MGRKSNRDRLDLLKKENEELAEESQYLQEKKISKCYEDETGRRFDPDEESNSVVQAILDSHDEVDSSLGEEIKDKIKEIENNKKIKDRDIEELKDKIHERKENLKYNNY